MSDVLFAFVSVLVACGFVCESMASSSLLVDSHILNKVCLAGFWFGLVWFEEDAAYLGVLWRAKDDTAVAILGPEQL